MINLTGEYFSAFRFLPVIFSYAANLFHYLLSTT